MTAKSSVMLVGLCKVGDRLSGLDECVGEGHRESHVNLVENEHLKAMLWMSEG